MLAVAMRGKLKDRRQGLPLLDLSGNNAIEANAMMDLLYIGLTLVLFVATLGLIRLFEMLMEGPK